MLEVYVHVTKRDENILVAHAGWVTDTEAAMRTGPVTFGQVVEGLAGMDPLNVANRLPEIAGALDPGQRRQAYRFLTDLQLACDHCNRVRVMRRPSLEQRNDDSDSGTTVADLYQGDFEIRIRKDGAWLS